MAAATSALAFCASASAADVGAFKPPFLDISLKTAFAAACATCAGVAPNCDANATAVDALACPGAIEPPAEFGFAPSIAETDDNPAAPHFMSPPPSSSSLLSMFSSSSSLSSSTIKPAAFAAWRFSFFNASASD